MTERVISNPRLDYIQLPKEIGQVDFDTLLQLAAAQEREYETGSSSEYFRGSQASVVSSCYVEAGLVLHDPKHDYDDYRVSLIDDAEKWAKLAAEHHLTALETGQLHPDDQEKWLRAEVQVAFMDVYRDLVCSEVTQQTQHELLTALEKVGSYTFHVAKTPDLPSDIRIALRGLGTEINVLHALWKSPVNARNPMQNVAIPSTYRGGDGRRLRGDTHDIATMSQSAVGEPFILSGTHEVKTHGSLMHDPSALGRYTSSLLKVGRHGIQDLGRLRELPESKV